MTEFEEKMYKNGLIKLSHTLTKCLTPMNELVLSSLIVERDYAVQNGYITDDGYFITNEDVLSYHTGLSDDAVCAGVKNLKRRNLIQSKVYENLYFVRIDEEQIIKAVEEIEHDDKYYYGNWDEGLKKVQEKILKLDMANKGE